MAIHAIIINRLGALKIPVGLGAEISGEGKGCGIIDPPWVIQPPGKLIHLIAMDITLIKLNHLYLLKTIKSLKVSALTFTFKQYGT